MNGRTRRAGSHRILVRRRSPGQALVEMALVSTVLVLLMASAFDLGRVFYATITVSAAARAGALQAAITPNAFRQQDCSSTSWDATNAIICAVEDETASSLVHITYGQVAVACADVSGNPVTCQPSPQTSTRSRVSVTASLTLLTPILQAILGTSVPISTAAIADQKALPAPVTQ